MYGTKQLEKNYSILVDKITVQISINTFSKNPV